MGLSIYQDRLIESYDLNYIIIYFIYFWCIFFKRVEYLFIRNKYNIKEVVIDFQIKCDIFKADNMAHHHDKFF